MKMKKHWKMFIVIGMIYNPSLLFCTTNSQTPFDFDAPEKPTDKKQYEKNIDAATQKLKEQLETLEKKEQAGTVNRSVSRALMVDNCAQIVAIHKEYQAQKNPLSYFFFKHPHLYDATLISTGFLTGIATYWLFLN